MFLIDLNAKRKLSEARWRLEWWHKNNQKEAYINLIVVVKPAIKFF